MPVRYYKAPFQTQQPGGFGDVLQQAANNWVRNAKTPDELAELRARTGLYDAQTGLTGEQTNKLRLENTQTQGGTDAYREAGDALSGLQPGAPAGTIYDKLSGIFSGHGLDPEAGYKLGARYVGTHGGTEEDMARGHFGADLTGTPVSTTYLPATAQARQKEGEAADFAKGKYAADASSGASMYDARLRAGAMQSDTAARVGELRDEAAQRDKTTRDDFAAREAGLNSRAEADRRAKANEPRVTSDKQSVQTPIGIALGKFYQGYDPPAPDQTSQIQSEAERELAAGEQPNPDAAAYHAFHRYMGTPKVNSGYFHSTMGPGDDAEMQFGKPAPTVSPPPADTTAGNPDAANGGASAADSAMGPTPAHIAALKANPQMAAQFDAKFGAGTAQRILGGG